MLSPFFALILTAFPPTLRSVQEALDAPSQDTRSEVVRSQHIRITSGTDDLSDTFDKHKKYCIDLGKKNCSVEEIYQIEGREIGKLSFVFREGFSENFINYVQNDQVYRYRADFGLHRNNDYKNINEIQKSIKASLKLLEIYNDRKIFSDPYVQSYVQDSINRITRDIEENVKKIERQKSKNRIETVEIDYSYRQNYKKSVDYITYILYYLFLAIGLGFGAVVFSTPIVFSFLHLRRYARKRNLLDQ